MQSTGWILLVLCAAAAHATWNAIVKSGADRTASMGLVICTGGVLGTLALPFVGPMTRDGWYHVAASAALHCGYYAFLLGAYARGDLSHVYPIARGLAPVLVALSSFLADESLAPIEWLGLAFVAAGLLLLAFPKRADGAPSGRATLFAAATGVLIAGYTLNDALGTRGTPDGVAYIAWLHVAGAAPFALYLVAFRRDAFSKLPRREIVKGVAGGLLGAAGYAIALLAARVGKVAHVAALRETSVLFAAFLGARMLREHVGASRIFAAVLVATGLVVMHAGL